MKAKLIWKPPVPNPGKKLKVYVFRGVDDKWYSRIKARNGEPIYHSEGVTNYLDCVSSAKLVNFPIYEIG